MPTDTPSPADQTAASSGAPTAPKPGFKTTEFWLSTIATLLGAALASGAFPDGGIVAQLIGGVLSVLAALGYTAARAQVKSAAGKPQPEA